MKEKTLGIGIGILDVLLIGMGVFFFVGKDTTAPVITLAPVDFVYEEELPQNLLYQGVTAWDNKDGDVTETVVIEKIVTDRIKGTASITYGACDTSGNVGKVTRTMDMPVLTLIQFPGAGEADETGSSQTTTETVAETTEALPEGNETTEVLPEEREAQEENTEEETGNTQTVGGVQDTARPTLVFGTRELTVKVGETIDFVSAIEEVTDDKDSKESLLETLEIKGEYNSEAAGSYYVTLTVTDSDGNVSNAYPLRVIVEE